MVYHINEYEGNLYIKYLLFIDISYILLVCMKKATVNFTTLKSHTFTIDGYMYIYIYIKYM